MAAPVLRTFLLLLTAGCALPLLAQAPAAETGTPVYDVVSVKPNKTGEGGTRVNQTLERYAATNATLKMLLRYAYRLTLEDQISGLPGWAESAHYDIEGKVDADDVARLKSLPKEESDAQRRLMMQRMLAERFQLKMHREQKEMPIYVLAIAKSGQRLKTADPNDTYAQGIKGPDGIGHAGTMAVRDGKIVAQGVPISNLVNILAQQLHRQVLAQTGIQGNFDFTLHWARDDVPADGEDAPSLFTALQEQLGLKLDATKGPVDTIVVDHVEPPTEN